MAATNQHTLDRPALHAAQVGSTMSGTRSAKSVAWQIEGANTLNLRQDSS